MAYSDFKREFDLFMLTNWTETPIYDYLNRADNNPSLGTEFISYYPSYIGDSTNSISQGPHCILTQIGITFGIFVPSMTGVDRAIQLSEILKDFLQGERLPENIEIFDSEGPMFGNKPDDRFSGKFFKSELNFAIEHRYFKQ